MDPILYIVILIHPSLTRTHTHSNTTCNDGNLRPEPNGKENTMSFSAKAKVKYYYYSLWHLRFHLSQFALQYDTVFVFLSMYKSNQRVEKIRMIIQLAVNTVL